MGKLVMIGVLISSLVGWGACNRPKASVHQHEPVAQQTTGTGPGEKALALKAPGEAQLGDSTTCAMHQGPAFTVTESTPKAEYGGRTYYFCCDHCAKRFQERPGDYVK